MPLNILECQVSKWSIVTRAHVPRQRARRWLCCIALPTQPPRDPRVVRCCFSDLSDPHRWRRALRLRRGPAGRRARRDLLGLRPPARQPGRGHGRAWSHCRFVAPLIHFTPDSLTDSVPLFLTRSCDRTLGHGRGPGSAAARAHLVQDAAAGQPRAGDRLQGKEKVGSSRFLALEASASRVGLAPPPPLQ